MYKKQEKELQNIVFSLINSNMTVFYGLFLTEVNKFFSTRIPTACLAKHPNAKIPVMLFNPDFWDKLNEKQRTFLVLHETQHLIDQAFLFCKEFALEKPLDNIALDLTINSRLMVNYQGELEFIEGGMLPANFPELQLEEEKDSLYYYNKLKEAKDKKEESKGKGEDSKAGEPGNGNGTSGDKNLDDLLDNQEKIDKHVTWEELTEGLSDLEKEVLKRDIMNRLDKISDEVAKQNGNVPKHLEGLLNRITKIKEVVNWKSLFRKFVGSTISSETLPNRKRPSRRFEENPGIKQKFKVSGVFLSDSSGSVGDDDLLRCNAELYNVWKAGGDVEYAAWDAECDTPKKYDGKLEITRTRGGGTDLNCALVEVNNSYRQKGWNFAIITTDGYIPAIHVKTKIPTMIIITEGGSTTFDNPYNYKIVKIN
jgi:predicted metal-dependent peptidase